MVRTADDREGQNRAVDIARSQRDDDRSVLIGRSGNTGDRGRIVNAIDCDRHDRGVARSLAIVNGEAKTVQAIKIARRCVGHVSRADSLSRTTSCRY